ncbi:hypothetical protein QTP70_020556 [Hemibagrus guttatus]|uniref:Integrase catalytic domain-containing protein n=1 Tax=Hemibagrus guttatus TaxID=175788 RepID=A0AAE0QX93_9TELE|nr:hypothetical protein QTP70_020556 [Hemibagrus guttatus]
MISQQGVEMNQSKVHAVTEWPEPTTMKELQRFLGFTSFYQQFIRNYSSVASPLTFLLRGKPKRLACKPVPMKGLPMVLQTAEALFQHVFHNFGLPEGIVSDRGPQFTSRVWRSFCKHLGINIINMSSGYHPQSNGQAERSNKEIRRFLRSYCSREQQRWSEFLPWAEYALNSLTQSSMGLTPFQCVLGYQPLLFPWTSESSDVPVVVEWSRLSQEVWEHAYVHLQLAIRRQRFQANQHRSPHPPYTVG